MSADVARQIGGRGVAAGLVFLERFGDDGLDVTAIGPVDRAEGCRVVLHNCPCRLVYVACDVVRQVTGEQFVEDDTQRVDVAADVEVKRIREDLLRTHIRERSDELADVGLPCRMRVAVGDPGNAKIQNLRLPALVHEDVARFQIAMNDAALVRVVNGVADLDHQLQPLPNGQMPGRGVCEERLAANEFHGKVRLWAEPPIGGGGFVDLRDPGVLEPAERQRFLFEAAKQLGG